MKTLKTIASKVATLLAWACVLGVLVLGARNAHAQGYPVKPKFQDVRIGYNTFAECEAEWGAFACDFSVEQSAWFGANVGVAGNFFADTIEANSSLNAATLNATDINAQNITAVTSLQAQGVFTASGLAVLDGGIDGVGSWFTENNTSNTPLSLRLTNQATVGSTSTSYIDMSTSNNGADTYIYQHAFVTAYTFGVDTSAQRWRICGSSALGTNCQLDFHDSLGIEMLAPFTYTGNNFIVDADGGADELQIIADTILARNVTATGDDFAVSVTDDIAIAASDAASFSGTSTTTIGGSTNILALSPGNALDIDIGSGGSTITANDTDNDIVVTATSDLLLEGGATVDIAGNTLLALAASNVTINEGGGGVQIVSDDTTVVLALDDEGISLTDTGNSITVDDAVIEITGPTTVNGSAVCTQDGTNCPASATRTFGLFTNGGSCTTVLGSNIASCTRSVQGVVSITFTDSYATAPACTSAPTSADQISVRVTSTTGGVTVRTYADGSGLDDTNFSLICEGNFP